MHGGVGGGGGGGGGAAGMRDSAIISFAPRRYTREQLLELRCSTLVRRRPRYIEEAIALRKSWCRYQDLQVAGVDGDESSPPTAEPSSGGLSGGGGSRQSQTGTRITRIVVAIVNA